MALAWMMPLKNFGVAEMTYYDYEFSRLGEQQADLKIQNEQGQTRWLTVSPEKLKQILDILNIGEES
jgi:hypothetical protein